VVLFDHSIPNSERRLEVKSGALVTDTDYVGGSGGLVGPLAWWARSSDMKRAALVADSTVHALDISYPSSVSAAAGLGRWGVLSDNQLDSFKGTFVIDAMTDTVRTVSQLRENGSGSVFTHAWAATHAFSSETGGVLFDTDQFLAPTEPGLVPMVAIGRSTGSWLFTTEAGAGGGALCLADVPFPRGACPSPLRQEAIHEETVKIG
jgi:hypothetical protein